MMNNGVRSLRTCLRLPEHPIFRATPLSYNFRRRFLVTASLTEKKKEKVIVISGPTGSGKSRLAMELAKRLNGEIVSADSVQVYKGLDVGSAKPSLNDRKEVPHHLVDILHPSEDYSVGQFFEDARQATRSILHNGRVPIVVGGTGLYLRWFIYGKPDVPKASAEITSEACMELAELQRNDDWEAAVQLVVKAGDPKVQQIAVNDWYRLRRSLEIIKSSGSPPSAFRVPYDSFREQGNYRVADGSDSSDMNTNYDATKETDSAKLDYDFMCFFLSSDRLDLYKSIDYRCEDMILEGDGLLSEAQWLLDTGLHPNSNSPTKAIGYRQAMDYLIGCREQGGQSSAGEFYRFLSEFQKASRNFAKRQLTWFRNERIYQWLDASKPLETVLNFIHDAYHNQNGNLFVPEHLRMSRDITNSRIAAKLKAYRTRNSEEEARKNIYSVSTRHYFAFGALCSEELSYKLKELPKVRWVLPDSYLNVKEKDYGGEPFINGQAVPYDPKYHEEWVRNNARANERNRRNDRPRNNDRSRNFERRRENVVNRDMQSRPPVQNSGPPPNNAYPPNNAGGYPPNNQAGYAPPNQAGYAPPNQAGYAPPNQGGYAPPNQAGYAPPNQGGYAPPNAGGGYPPPNMSRPPPPNMSRPPPPNSGYGAPQDNYPGNMGGGQQNPNMAGMHPNAGWSNNQ